MSSKKPKPDDDLAEAVAAILKDDAEVARLGRRIVRAQRRLQKQCSPKAWQAYLVVESETDARGARIAHVLLRYGLDLAKRYLEPKQ